MDLMIYRKISGSTGILEDSLGDFRILLEDFRIYWGILELTRGLNDLLEDFMINWDP